MSKIVLIILSILVVALGVLVLVIPASMNILQPGWYSIVEIVVGVIAFILALVSKK